MPKRCKTIYTNILVEMVRRNEIQSDVCKVLGLSQSALTNKFTGKSEWTISEIDKLCKHYDKDYYYLFHKDSE